MNTNPKLKKLQQKKSQIDARIKLIESREKAKAKKEDTRRKILIGAMVMEQMEKSEESKKKILASLNGFLTRPLDRMLFGLPETKQAQTPPPITPQGRVDSKSKGEKDNDTEKKSPQRKTA